MTNIVEVATKKLKEGRDYIRLGDKLYQKGDRFLEGDKIVTIRSILDKCHFFDEELYMWHTSMFSSRHCTHNEKLNLKAW